MIIIFEGCDCSGKSTLTEKLRVNTLVDWRVLNYRYPTLYKEMFSSFKNENSTSLISTSLMMVEQFATYMTSFNIFNELNYPNVICDRFWVGEFVYCVVRNYRYPQEFEKKWLDRFIAETEKVGGCLIYVKADNETLRKRMEKSKGEYITPEEVKVITKGYERIFGYIKERYNGVIEIDTSTKTKEESFNALMKKLAKYGLF